MNMQQALRIAQKRIDELQTLADTQAAIISTKNDEIDRLSAELARCQANSYADDIAVDEAGDEVQP